jgi:hypothetical protein
LLAPALLLGLFRLLLFALDPGLLVLASVGSSSRGNGDEEGKPKSKKAKKSNGDETASTTASSTPAPVASAQPFADAVIEREGRKRQDRREFLRGRGRVVADVVANGDEEGKPKSKKAKKSNGDETASTTASSTPAPAVIEREGRKRQDRREFLRGRGRVVADVVLLEESLAGRDVIGIAETGCVVPLTPSAPRHSN